MQKKPKLIGILILALLAGVFLTACGGGEEPPAEPTPSPTPTLHAGWYWKAGGFIDYAPSGMPDFDQKQDDWSVTAAAPKWSYCGPVAMANSLWWFDSRFEPSPVAPPVVNDNYPLVQSYSPGGPTAAGWDDHDPLNVQPLVDDLAYRMDTDGQTTGGSHSGTMVERMHTAVNQYISDKGLQDLFYAHMERSPEFAWIAQEVERSQDVVLLLGFWEWQGDVGSPNGEWVRIGGHYVTCAGVNTETHQVGISDPYLDNAEAGGDGRVPVAHAYPHDAAVHNDAQYVSHDMYDVVLSMSPGGTWQLGDYPVTDAMVHNFAGMNFADDLLAYQGDYDGGSINVEIDYAVAVSPMGTATPTPTATSTATATGVATQTVPPTAVPTATRTAPPTTGPTGVPTQTGGPTQTPPPTPDPSAPVITGIHSVHRSNPAMGGYTLEIHCLPTYFPQGTDIYDLHIFNGEQHLSSVYYDTPLVPCQWYYIDLEGTPPQCLTIYLTDEDHNIIGRIASWAVAPNVQDLTTWLTDLACMWPGVDNWMVELYPQAEYFGPGGTPTNIYDLHFYTDEYCDPIAIGDWQSATALNSSEWYDFELDWNAAFPAPDVVVIEVTDEYHEVWGIAFSWSCFD